ncbi:MAG: M48 family metalloprotease [Planctomycetaceae bacterium]
MAWHRALLEYLKNEEAELWDWFSSNKVVSEAAESVRLELLKSAYRIDRDSSPELYAAVDRVADRMSAAMPVTLYQSQHASGLNASLAFLPDEVHIVFYGPIQETLADDELAALLAHELAHHELFSLDEGEFLIAGQILTPWWRMRQRWRSRTNLAFLAALHGTVLRSSCCTGGRRN